MSSTRTETAADAAQEPPMGDVVPLKPGRQLSQHPEAVRARRRRRGQKSQAAAETPAARPAGRSAARKAAHPAGHDVHLTEHLLVAIICLAVVAVGVKVAYGSFATIEGSAVYLTGTGEQGARLAWSVVGAEVLLALFLGLAHRVARFRSLARALVLMLLACVAVEASMAYVRTEAAVHLAVGNALQAAQTGRGEPAPAKAPEVSVSTEGRSRGAIKDMTGLTDAAARLAQTQADAQARQDARADLLTGQAVRNAKDRSRLARWIPVIAATVQAGATELGGLAVAELVFSLLAIGAAILARGGAPK